MMFQEEGTRLHEYVDIKGREYLKSMRKLTYYLVESSLKKGASIAEIGEKLVEIGHDDHCDGFWILDIPNNAEWYSPKFRKTLGFESEKDFPNTPASWQGQICDDYKPLALELFHDHINSLGEIPYVLEVEYYKKNREKIGLVCDGDVVKWDDTAPIIMKGDHYVLEPIETMINKPKF